MDMSIIDLTPVLQAQIALLAAWITARVIPWLKSRTSREQQDYLLSTAKILVYAAEQLYGAGKGDVKLQYVEDELAERGLKVDVAAIEAAVREMNLLDSWEGTVIDAKTTEGKGDAHADK